MTKIEWTDETWNPTRGCSMATGSELGGCLNCYAARNQLRRPNQTAASGKPFAILRESGPRWSGEVELVESKLTEPLRWKQPRRVFVNSMSDLFHEALPDEHIACVVLIMAMCPHLDFQVLTKRAQRLPVWMKWFQEWASEPNNIFAQCASLRLPLNRAAELFHTLSHLPLPNVWLGVSVEDQTTADARIPLLLQTPAALRFVSYEPALAGVDFTKFLRCPHGFSGRCAQCEANARWNRAGGYHDLAAECRSGLDWGIVGGESGPQARPCDLAWIESAVDQFASVPLFVKQVGSKPVHSAPGCLQTRYPITDAKGGNWDEWPKKLRVREFPR